ncbi:hypothetical protein H6P81_006280 [Aristolochia fimbriata]|uniref:Uncharacterized protein n=1 Tax=Aristolochia fimbriata TaxID=158543 RepID=A0AAV7F0K4_ARIFI|nr:hypothetical protein H6P81_006280 [Aristolochia fimbriata]
MKLSSKPVSSNPGRPENFPPPLTRSLLSTNGRSRSRKVRSSPMFRRKGVDSPEPGSPKVTCMGQIRVRKSRQHASSPRRPRLCLHTLFSFSSPRKPNWRNLFASCFQKKVQGPEYSQNKDLSPRREAATKAAGVAVVAEEELARSEGDFATPTPPKNALLLMRCRSEPHRSSVLANQFWGSPGEPRNPGSKEDKEEEEDEEEAEEEEEEQGKRDGRRRLSEGDRWLERIGRSGPVILTRCRSEPGRRRKSEAPFWTGTSLGLADACRSPVLL